MFYRAGHAAPQIIGVMISPQGLRAFCAVEVIAEVQDKRGAGVAAPFGYSPTVSKIKCFELSHDHKYPLSILILTACS